MKTNTLAVVTAIAALTLGAGCVPATKYAAWADFDGDGFGDPNVYLGFVTEYSPGIVNNFLDCDDDNVNNYPGNTEVGDDFDNNCNDLIDEIRIDAVTFNDYSLRFCVLNAAEDAGVTYTLELTSLTCRRLGITDATGVDQLIALTKLDLQDAAIPNINVEDMTSLTHLNVSRSNISSIDVSNNPALEFLSVGNLYGDHPHITHIDISNNPELQTFHAPGHALTGSIDLTHNPLLVDVNLVRNQISGVNVSNNPLLVSLKISNNQISNLNLNSNPMLEILHVSDNQLNSLSLSLNTALKELYANINSINSIFLDDNNQLNKINLAGNNLATLSLANHPGLSHLNLLGNPLALEAIQGLEDLTIDTFLYDGVDVRYIFMTSTSHTGDLGGLDGADSICQAEANASDLPTATYKAWLSSSSASAASRLTHSEVPYIRPDLRLVANGWTAFNSGQHLDSISTLYGKAWTNTDYDGGSIQQVARLACDDWTTSERYYSNEGNTYNMGAISHTYPVYPFNFWSSSAFVSGSCHYDYHLFCIQQ